MKTDIIGAITNPAIKTEFMDQISIFFWNKILFLFILASIKMYLLKPNLYYKNIADDQIKPKSNSYLELFYTYSK
jgi:hypothetical protein